MCRGTPDVLTKMKPLYKIMAPDPVPTYKQRTITVCGIRERSPGQDLEGRRGQEDVVYKIPPDLT